MREALERILTPFLSYRLLQVVLMYVQSSAVQVTVVTPVGWILSYRINRTGPTAGSPVDSLFHLL